MTDQGIAELLQRLSSPAAGAAWSAFLDQYSTLIMQVVHRYESDPGRATDCFIDACAALSDHGFRRLRAFRADGSARFDTWLKAVVANLCIDWRRQQRGRFRPSRAIAGLPEVEQRIFHCLYVRGMARAECLHALQAQYPDLTEDRLAQVNARLFELLTGQQRWQLNARRSPPLSLDRAAGPDPDERELQIEAPGPGPESLAEFDQDRARVRAALRRLEPHQRLLLRLRFEQDLTLAAIARQLGLPDPFHARRQVDAALAALAAQLEPAEPLPHANPGDLSV
jgi:RNA polymerase sigma factor (sigma-70 family)